MHNKIRILASETNIEREMTNNCPYAITTALNKCQQNIQQMSLASVIPLGCISMHPHWFCLPMNEYSELHALPCTTWASSTHRREIEDGNVNMKLIWIFPAMNAWWWGVVVMGVTSFFTFTPLNKPWETTRAVSPIPCAAVKCTARLFLPGHKTTVH